MFEELTRTLGRIETELEESAKREGLPVAYPTGNIWIDVNAEMVWYEIVSERNLAWVSPDAPEHAAHGETLVAAASRDEAEEWGREH